MLDNHENIEHLLFVFQTPGGERWYVSRLQLIYTTDNKLFEHVAMVGVKAELGTKVPALLFPTPVGKSYACSQETAVLLQVQDQQ